MKHGSKRTYGTGSLMIERGSYYGQFRVSGRLVKRKLGAVRKPGTRDGMTKAQAERRLRQLIEATDTAPPTERLTLTVAGERYVRHLELVMERKPSTTQDYRIILKNHLVPFFGTGGIDKLTADDVTAYLHRKARAGLARQSIVNQINFLHAIFKYSMKRGWVTTNPVLAVDRPQSKGHDPDVRYIEMAEVEALLRAVPDDALGGIERVLYLAAALTGLRQGELIALRWRDVDWPASVIRVRRAYVRGSFTTPKSRRGSRAVPFRDRLGGELARHFQASPFQGDGDLVFAHPETGNPLDASKLRKRFVKARKAAKLRDDVRFHDLRHTFGTLAARSGVSMRTLMEWMGHRDLSTTLVYADFAPSTREADLLDLAFAADAEAVENTAAPTN
jgi:integrase